MILIEREFPRKNKSRLIKWNPPGQDSYIATEDGMMFINRKTRRKLQREYEKRINKYSMGS